MADGFELTLELNEAISAGYRACDQWEREQRDAAVKEDEYRRVKSVAYVKAKAEGIPATTTPAIVDGWEEVADARLAWQLAERVADAEHERLLLIKKQIAVLQDEVGREWARAKVL